MLAYSSVSVWAAMRRRISSAEINKLELLRVRLHDMLRQVGVHTSARSLSLSLSRALALSQDAVPSLLSLAVCLSVSISAQPLFVRTVSQGVASDIRYNVLHLIYDLHTLVPCNLYTSAPAPLTPTPTPRFGDTKPKCQNVQCAHRPKAKPFTLNP